MGIDDFVFSPSSGGKKARLDLANFDLSIFEGGETSPKLENQICRSGDIFISDLSVSLSHQGASLALNVSEIDWNKLSSQGLGILLEEQGSEILKDRLLKVVDENIILDIAMKLLGNDYKIINTKRLRKNLCKFLRSAGKEALFDALFSSNMNGLHPKNVGAWAIVFGEKGHRILIEMRNAEVSGKIEYWIDGLYTHGEYINRLKEKKR